jgi:glycolate oxidase FAD binding subunit
VLKTIMTSATTIQPRTIEDVQAAVRENARLLPRGGGTKPGLSTPTEGVTALDMSVLTGVLEYNPNEFTFTALAGTRVAEVQAMLAEYGQYLPFDPPLADKGATLGGTVASGLSGPGRYRYGGARDFILGVRLVDGNGDVIRGGGKVVKNSAGFDIPKMMVGSLGQLGVLIETTFKVFPQSPTHITVRHSYRTFNDALNALYRLCTARLDVEALDLMPVADGAEIWVRLGGLPDALPTRAERIRTLLEGGAVLPDDTALWAAARDFHWVPPGWTLAKIPLTPKHIASIEALPLTSHRRYSSGGNVVWLAMCESISLLDEKLTALGLSGLVVIGPPGQARIGKRTAQVFEQRVKAVFDPQSKFFN